MYNMIWYWKGMAVKVGGAMRKEEDSKRYQNTTRVLLNRKLNFRYHIVSS